MKKLNNKGLSIIELLVCFVIVATISISLLNIIMEYKGIQETENIKNIIRTYKDEVVQVLEQDIIKKTLSSAEAVYSNNKCTITLTFKNMLYEVCNLSDKDKCYQKELVVYTDNQNNYIEYPDIVKNGSVEEEQKIRYYLPKTTDIYSAQNNLETREKRNDIYFRNLPTPSEECDEFICNNVFKLYIPIEHSEIDSTYAIDIVVPVTP